MKIISFREKAMLLCMLVLIFFFISIFVRLGAKQILIKRLHWDNAITHTIFFDNKTDRASDRAIFFTKK